MYIDEKDFEERLNIARSRGATDAQIQAKRQQYSGQLKPRETGVKRVARAITKPVTDIARDTAGAALGLGAGVGEIAQRLTVDPQNKNKFFDKGLQKATDIMTDRGRKAFTGSSADALKLGAQRGLQASSYVVPGGKTLKGAVGLGAAGGALGGAGEKAENFEDFVANVGAGAIGGGIGGGAVYGAGKAITGARQGVRSALTKGGDKIDDAAKNVALREFAPSPSQQAKFKKQTGNYLEDFIQARPDLIGVDADSIDDAIRPLQSQFDDLTRNSGKKVPLTDIKARFAEQIADLTSAQKRLVPGNLEKAGYLANQLQGVEELAGGQGTIDLATLVNLRSDIDAVIPSSQFGIDPANYSGPRSAVDVYRGIQNDYAGSKEIGKELASLRNFKDVLVRNRGKGRGTGLLGMRKLLSGGAGATVGGPVGLAAGMAVEEAVNSPAGTRAIAQGLKGVANVAQNAGAKEVAEGGVSKALQSRAAQILGRQVGSQLATQDRPEFQQLPELKSPESTGMDNTIYSPMVVGELQARGIDPLTKFLVTPDGQRLWNPTTQTFSPYNPNVYGDPSTSLKSEREDLSKDEANASSGLRATSKVRELILPSGEVDRSVLTRSLLPFGGGSADAQVLTAARSEMQDVIQRLRTGAAISAAEEDFYLSLLPRATDTQETIEYKLENFEQLFSSLGGR